MSFRVLARNPGREKLMRTGSLISFEMTEIVFLQSQETILKKSLFNFRRAFFLLK